MDGDVLVHGLFVWLCYLYVKYYFSTVKYRCDSMQYCGAFCFLI